MTSPVTPDRTRPPVVPVRHYGQWITVAIVVALLAKVIYEIAANSVIRWEVVVSRFGAEAILQGLGVTVVLTIVSMVLGVVLGVGIAVMRISRNRLLSAFAFGFVWLFRGTPLLVQVLVWFNLSLFLPTIDLGFTVFQTNTIPPFAAAILALALNEAAYMAEIVRGGILSVDRGQAEAAGALGMTPGQTMARIVLPQAMRSILPPTGNELVTLLKETSLVSVIGAGDMLYRAQQIGATDFTRMEMLIIAACWYLVLTTVASVLQLWIERRFDKDRAPSAWLARMLPLRARKEATR
ncbi:amino acid ABC transporter permease [Microbacterium marinilacus]|uniref:Amino acid ABC transporter permease n=1 Tax=Microbacterium marinilacus TaxID=415209 RepID=A0ABP7B9K2_9MICO|nr:amino acid ABC transporter permease [Microbacterium marinilacus]MBY0687320.1 amino acid ABC transporter permease [Microbacterium marinilacus]